MRGPLFRKEVSATRSNDPFGKVVLMQPLSLRIVNLCVVLFAAGMLVFLFAASYTRRVPASGVLLPAAGILRIQAPHNGVVLERRVHEGEAVKAGQLLYVISEELMYAPALDSSQRAGLTEGMLANLHLRQQVISADRADNAALAEREQVQERARVASLTNEIAQLDGEIAIQAERLASKQTQYDRNAEAQTQGFLSPLGLQQKYDELLDQKARLKTMQRSRVALERDQAAAQASVDSLRHKQALTQSQLRRQSLEVEQDRATRESNGRTLVTAPQDGTVAAVLVEPGQRSDGQTLLTLLPRDAELEVQLFIASAAIGFIHQGDAVTVRFAAFPYQTFGGMNGLVAAISSTTLNAAEQGADNTGAKAPADSSGDGRYRVRIRLPAQALQAGGRSHPLRSGMQVDVQFAQERRTLMGWLFEPLQKLKDKA